MMSSLLTRAYYALKPSIPWQARLALRRRLARRVRRRLPDRWYINEAAGRVPDGWPGWPDGKQFAFVVTHDVDGTRGLDRCLHLAETDRRHWIQAAFNFVPEGPYVLPAWVRDLLTGHGFEVGVHDLHHDGTLYMSRERFTADARTINRYLEAWRAVGFRSAFMFHELSWIRDLDVLYDASTFDVDPFEPQPDGANTIFPFWVARDDGTGYVELPYTLTQDSTLFVLLQETSIDTWRRKLDWIVERGGMALVNVHPDYTNFDGRPGAREFDVRLYEDFLDYAVRRYGRDGWFALPRQVAEYVRRAFPLRPPRERRVGSAVQPSGASSAATESPAVAAGWRLRGKRAAMVVFSHYPADPRVLRAAETLASEGMSVDVLCLTDDDGDARRELLNGVDVLRIPLKRRRGRMTEYVIQYATFIARCFAILAARSVRRRYDVVYVHNMPDVLVLTALVPKLLGAKVILDLHDPMPELMMSIFNLPPDSVPVRTLKRLEKWSISLADAALTVNAACKRLFSSRSCTAEKMGVVMNSPDDKVFGFRSPCPTSCTDRVPGTPFVIMYHGSLVERNGLHVAVAALAEVRRAVPDAELWIYGPANAFLERVMAQVRAKGLTDAVQYRGRVRSQDIVAAIAQCDVGVIPNERSIFTELNTPTRIFEYLAVGKPVIAPAAPGIRDYFDDDSLIFFDLGNAADLARRIEYVYSHPAEVLEVVQRGQDVYRAHGWREQRRTLVNVTAELVSR